MKVRIGVRTLAMMTAASLAFVSNAGAQSPDVIVGDLHQVEYWGSSQGIDAYSVGTVSCNIGDAPLLWIPDSNEHPVIAQHMYRLKDGRFEQIGQSWLKHGFAALTQSLCDTCQNPGTSQLLGVGCSDPYSASLNGSQTRLGPKFEVDPYTGIFVWPHTDPTGNGTIAGRLQVPASDMDPAQNPGAQYFVEGHYVTPDDAAAGNHMNNVSWRPINVFANHDISLTGSTVREEPAILAWQANDPTVGIVSFDVLDNNTPVDGRFYLGLKVTDVGGGNTRYEFAVYNMNSDRGMQMLEIPVPAGATVSSDYFHDVDYHSGEPYSGTDWTFQHVSGAVTFSTDTFATNENANALRWGTLYNYGFTTDAPPEDMTIARIWLFKPGAPDFVDVQLPIGDVGDNDLCFNAQLVTDGAYAFDNIGATTDGPDEPGSCDFFGYTHIDSDVWYRYIAPATGLTTIDLCNSDFDTKMAVYGASCPAGPGEAIACNDDANCGGGAAGNNLGSQVAFAVEEGQEYLIRIGGYQGAQGTGTMNIVSDGSFVDCNENGVDDAEDIANGTSQDCNENNVPDECEGTGGKVVLYESTVNPPLAIPDGTGQFVSHSFNVPDSGVINDLNVDLQITHTWNGDLIVKLEHNGTEVVLIDRPGYTGSGFGYNNNGFDITLDDEGTGGPIENEDSGGGTVTSPPSYTPNEPLSAFDRMDRQGVWTISVSDNAGQDTGTLDYVALAIEGEGGKIPPCITDCNNNGVDDATDILKGTSEDCNKNEIPDECDIAAGEPDCAGGPIGDPGAGAVTYADNNCANCHASDGSGGFGPDIRNKSRVEIWNMLQPPTDHPGGEFPQFTQVDYANLEAFLSTGGSRGRPDLIPDVCQPNLPDCDGDGTTDACELELGTQVDLDYDGIPDDCQTVDCPSDLNGDLVVDAADLATLLGDWGFNPGSPADLNGDDFVNAADLATLLGDWGPCD